jgi:integrase
MASIHRKEKSPFWFCAFYLPDGRRTLRSTGTSDKRKANAICVEWERASRDAKEGRFTEARARDTITTIYQIAHQEELPQSTTKDFIASWLKTKELTLADSSLAEYNAAAASLLAHLGAKAQKHMDVITVRDLSSFRDSLAERVSGATVNKTVKILRGAWHKAMKDGIIRDNVFARIDLVKESASKRRAFTLDELRSILAACDVEWRGMVLCGVYLGQRLGDIARLTWRNVDVEQKEVRLITQKTGKAMKIPLHPVLENYFLSLSAPDDVDAPVFPRTAATAAVRVGTLSNQFADILAAAGLQKVRDHQKAKDGAGRDVERKVGRLSYHCLRHTSTSLLKNAGVSDVIAREIIGHDSPEISRVYTHMEKPAMKDAMDRLPDITATAKKSATKGAK